MNGQQIERVAKALGAQQNRRSVVRLVGAVVLGGAGLAAFGGSDTPAKSRKRRKQSAGRCRPGSVLQRLQVSANGDAVETKQLKSGESYRLRVSGYIKDEEWGLDGEYYFLRDDPGNLSEVYDACFDGTPVGLAVSGAAFAEFGDYHDDHLYERKVIGKGQPLALRLSDCRYEENTGSLAVELLCG